MPEPGQKSVKTGVGCAVKKQAKGGRLGTPRPIPLCATLITSPRLGPEAEIGRRWRVYVWPSGDVCIPPGINPIHAGRGSSSILGPNDVLSHRLAPYVVRLKLAVIPVWGDTLKREICHQFRLHRRFGDTD
jgi:hypothetical protein